LPEERAGIVMRVVEKNDNLSLDADPVSDFFHTPWWLVPPKSNIMVKHLLLNTSGIPGLVSLESLALYSAMIWPYTTLEVASYSIFLAPDWFSLVPPGTQFRYGGAQWQLAGGVAERVSGKP